MIRLVVTDLDGTLLAPDGTIPDANVEAIREAHSAGWAVAVATGRPVRWLDCLDPIADLHPYVLASNGAVVYDLATGEVLRSHAFDRAAVVEITDAISAAVGGVLFGLERGDLFGTEPGSPSDHRNLPGVLLRPLAELVERVSPVVKVLAYSRSMGTDALASEISDAVGALATVTTSLVHDQFGMAELSVPGVTKSRTLAELCADLGVEASEVVAFGDMPNDLEMLDWAGRAFVMDDGHPLLQSRFEGAGACGDAGVGRVIRALLRG